MTQKTELGQFGEDLACEYLVKKDYKIIDRNFRQKWGELDIIAKAPDKTLVFVEVKTMADYPKLGLKPEDQLTKSKLQKLKRAASLYAGHNPELIKDEKGWQIDLLALTLRETSGLRLRDSDSRRSTLNELNGLTIKKKSCDVKHYENIG